MLPLLRPRRRQVDQLAQGQAIRLIALDYRLDDVGREQAQPQETRNVGVVQAEVRRHLADGGMAAVFERLLPAMRTPHRLLPSRAPIVEQVSNLLHWAGEMHSSRTF